jgi:hypothetical protein
MDHVLLTNHEMLELPELPQVHQLRQADIMAAADTVPSLMLLQAYQKDINQDLPALLLINLALADIDHDLLVALPAELADTDLIPQEDLLAQAELADLDDDHHLQWIPAQAQNHPLANTLLLNHVKKTQQENSKTSKISRRIKSQKSIALLTPAINKDSEMRTMKAGAHAKAAVINGCHPLAKNSSSVLKH